MTAKVDASVSDQPWFKDRSLFQATFLAALAVYGYAVTNFSLHIDVEAAAVYGSFEHTLALGRWGITLVHLLLLHEPVAPYFTIVLSLLLLSAAAVATERVFNFGPTQRYAFTILYVSFPQFAYQLEFSNQSDCVAFGLLLATLSFLCLQRFFQNGRIAFAVGSVALLVLGTSFYESIVFVVPVLCTLSCLQRTLNEPVRVSALLREYAWSAVITVSAYFICILLGWALQRHFGVTPSDYLGGLIGWRSHSMPDAVRGVVRFVSADVFGRDFYGNALYLAAVVAAAVIILSSLLRRLAAGRAAIVSLLAVASLLAPFVIVAVLGEHQEPRTFVTEQIAFAALIAMAFSVTELRASWQTAAVGVLVLTSCLHVSRLFFSDTMAWTADRLLGDRIVQEIYRAQPTFQERDTPVYFHGAYAPPNIWMGKRFNVFGNSFFMWDGGATFRISAFFKASGIANFKLPTPQDAANAERGLHDLPTWPNPNSIHLVNGVMVVRLGQ